MMENDEEVFGPGIHNFIYSIYFIKLSTNIMKSWNIINYDKFPAKFL